MLRFATLLLTLLLIPTLQAQTVTVDTIVPAGSAIDDALSLGPDGALYGSRFGIFGGEVGRTVTRIDLTDGSSSVYVDGLNRSNGHSFDADGNLYVASFDGRTLEQVTPSGTRTTYATIPTGNPSGVLVHPTTGVIYVTNYTNDTVGIATGDGTITPFLSNDGTPPELNGPVGMVVDDAGQLYVSNFNDGKIMRVSDTGALTEIADLEGPNNNTTGFITHAGGFIFATAIGRHRIEEVDLSDGSVRTLAGTGIPGTVDGPGDTAQFNGPNGIVANATGDTLYVSAFGSRAIRRLVIDRTTGTAPEAPNPRTGHLHPTSPNPLTMTATLRFELDRPGPASVTLFDLLGRAVRLLADADFAAGSHALVLDARSLAPGAYLAQLRSGASVDSQLVHIVR